MTTDHFFFFIVGAAVLSLSVCISCAAVEAFLNGFDYRRQAKRDKRDRGAQRLLMEEQRFAKRKDRVNRGFPAGYSQAKAANDLDRKRSSRFRYPDDFVEGDPSPPLRRAPWAQS